MGLELDTKSEPTFCISCVKARPTLKPVPKERVNYISHVLGDKIHLDVWGPATPQSYNGKLYYVSFMDNYTRWTTTYCISQKLEVLAKYKEYKAWMQTQHGKLIKVLQSDRGGEYLSKDFNNQLPVNNNTKPDGARHT